MATLFVYGTLTDSDILEKVVGRSISGRPDSLRGYEKSTFLIDEGTFPVLIEKEGKEVNGLVLEVMDEELARIDEYETAAYTRKQVILEGGMPAWAFVKNKK